ncbi:serine acetyltransferase [Escherichia coli]|uniref:Serine acetyltransferase n=1 Tax=Escherichia coli TaxID=562 RepID=A0A376TYJ1_ECOLX|nr:serine acetyltransferase [Escherichia coli]
MIGAGAKILGNIEVGRGAKIGAGSVVLQTGAAAYNRRWRSGSYCR